MTTHSGTANGNGSGRPASAVPVGGGRAVAAPPGGWQLIAFSGELTEAVNGLALASRPLVAIREAGQVRIFDGTCPHRGAHLGHGGKLTDGPGIICPFHGKWIGLGGAAGDRSPAGAGAGAGAGSGPLCVREHEVIDAGGAVFVRLSDVPARDHGFARAIGDVLGSHLLIGAVAGHVPVPPELIIENAFDFAHFPTVHLISRLASPKVALGADGELGITTAFRTRAPAWEASDADVTSRFHARAFSPNLVLTELGPPASSNFVVTGATPAPGGCVARIAVAVRRGAPEPAASALVDGARHAFEQDLRVWQHLDLAAPACLDSRDAPVMAFRAFCAAFAAESGNTARDVPRGDDGPGLPRHPAAGIVP